MGREARRRWGRRVLAVLVGSFLLLVGLSQTEPAQDAASGAVQRVVQGILGEGWTFGRPVLRWTLGGRLTVRDVAFVDPEGRVAIGVRRLDLALAPQSLIWGTLRISRVRGDGVRVAMQTDEDGVLNLVRCFGGPGEPADPDAPPWSGLPFGIVVEDVGLRDGMVSLWGPPPVEGDPSGFAAKILRLSGDVTLPRHTTEVRVAGAKLSGVLLHPGPANVGLEGGVVWTGEGVLAEQVTVSMLGNRLGLHGYLRDMFGEGRVDLTVTPDPLDLSTLDAVFGAPLQGAYAGSLHAKGTLAALALEGALQGVGEQTGRLSFEAGSMVCLPVAVGVRDACAGPIEGDPNASLALPLTTEDTPLRWKAALDLQGLSIEDIVPSLGGPLRLEGAVRARGGGTTWPEGVYVEDGRWVGEELDAYGIRVRRLDAGIGLHGGVLELSDLDLAGVMGTVRGGGTIDFTDGQMDLGLRGQLDPSMLEDFGVTQLGGRGTYSGTVHGRLYDEGVPIDVSVVADMAPFTWDGDGVVLQTLHGVIGVDVFQGVVDVTGTLSATGAKAYGASADLLDATDVAVRVDGSEVTVRGHLAAPSLAYDTWAHFQQVDADVVVRVPEVDPVQVEVGVRVADHDLFGLMGNHGTVDVRLDGSDLWVDTNLRWDETPFVVAPDFHLDIDTLAMSLDTLDFRPTARQAWSNTAPIRLRVTDDGLADVDLQLTSALGSLGVSGTLGTTGRVDGRITTTALDLSALAELFPDSVDGLSGVVTLDARLSGRASRPTLDAQVTARRLYVDGVLRFLDLSGDLAVDADVATVDLAATVADVPLGRLVGSVPVDSNLASPGLSPDGAADLRLVVEAGAFERFERVVPDLDLPVGDLSGVFVVQGDLRDPDLDLQTVVVLHVPKVAERVRIEADVRRVGGVLDVAVDAYEGLEPILLVDGTAATRLGEISEWLLGDGQAPSFSDPSLFADDVDLTATLQDLPVRTLVEALDLPVDLAGELAGQVRIAGNPRRPAVMIDVDGALAAGGVPADIHVGLTPEDTRYVMDMTLGSQGERWLGVRGRLPVWIDLATDYTQWGTSTFDLVVDGSGLPLDLVRAVDAGIFVEAGRVEVSGRVDGTWTEPRPELVLSLVDARTQYRPLGLAVKQADALVRVTTEDRPDGAYAQVLLESLVVQTRPLGVSVERLAQVGDSHIEARGGLVLRRWTPDDIEASVTFRNAWMVATDRTELRASGNLSVGGRWPGLAVGGSVSVDQGRVELNTSDLTTARSMQIDPDITIHRDELVYRTATPTSGSVLEAIDLDVDLDLGRNAKMLLRVPIFDDLGAFASNVTRADIDARLGGGLRVTTDEGALSIVGEVDVLSGRVNVLRAKFAIDEGSRISFFGEEYANPNLEVGGTMPLSGGSLRLRLTGSAVAPKFDLSSDDFGSDAAIFTILLTGQAPDELSSEQGRAAIEAVSDLLLTSVLGGVNLGSVSVEADGSVRVGLPVFRTVFLETTYDPTPQLNENTVTVDGEWSILPRLLLRASYGDRLIDGGIFYELRLTTVCDRLREAYAQLEGDPAAIEARCGQMRKVVREASTKRFEDVESAPLP